MRNSTGARRSTRSVLVLISALLALLASEVSAQSGVEAKRRKDISRRVQRAMEKGDREQRVEKVRELVDEGAPWCVSVIARGVATSYKRSKRLEKKIAALRERNADLYKRLKINPVQKKGDRTRNDEINENLDAIDAMHERLAEERKFRGKALKMARDLARGLDAEKQDELARTLMSDLKASKGEQRLALIDVVGRTGLPVATAQALAVIRSNPDQILRLAAIDALGESGDEAAAEGLVPFLKDPRWQIRVAVVESLRKLRRKIAIPALIEAMAREEGRVREDILEALQDITGVDKADNPAVWRNWWNENKDKPLALRSPARKKRGAHPRAPGRGGAGGWRNRQAGAGGTSFYGIRTKSKHIVYVLDHSGSMKSLASSGQSTGNDGMGGLTKIEVAKNELWKSIEQLAPDATFNILFFQTDYTIFKEKMVKANAANKRAAKQYIDEIVADGYTNVYDTLKRAFEIGGQGAVDKAYKVNFDTIFFLTDGSPYGAGQTTDWKEILKEVDNWNKTKRIKVHCVGIGQHNSAFLQRLAANTGGEYTSRGQQPQHGGRKRKR